MSLDNDRFTLFKRKLIKNKFLHTLFSCPYKAPKWDNRVRQLIKEFGPHAKILDLGSGNNKRANYIINLDIEKMPNVDVVGNGHFLPFKDNIFDIVILEAVLEHVEHPNKVILEVNRVLKPGGWICVAVPFIQGYHASPSDYQRYTVYGLESLLSDFVKAESGFCVGPTSALHWIFKEYIGIIFSFSNIWVYKIISFIIGWLTFPLVYIDKLLYNNKNAHNIASAVFFIGYKKQ